MNMSDISSACQVDRERETTRFVRGGGVCEIEDLDLALGGADYHQRVLHVHRVAPFWELDCRYRVWRAQIPVLQKRINSELG